MDLTSKRVIKGLLKKYQIRPSKRLGQNFLIDKKIVKKIIRASNHQPKDVVLEIGPGIGVLTQELAKKTKKVIAIEKDPKMCEILKETLKDFKNVKLIQRDVLKTTHHPLPTTNYKLAANLPFYITAPAIRKFLEIKNPPKEMILIIQKEVAQRICAQPPRLRQGFGGQAKMNLLAVSVQFYSKPKIISYVSKKSFWPSPKVDSAIIQIIPRSSAYGSASFRKQFFRIVRAGFSQPRKQLANNLTKELKLNKAGVSSWLLKNNIQPSQRAETLTIKNWANLTETLK